MSVSPDWFSIDRISFRTVRRATRSERHSRHCRLWRMVLGHSHWLWGHFCTTQDLQTVMRYHIDAFASMDGAPSELLYDRMKTAVIGENSEGVVSYNVPHVAPPAGPAYFGAEGLILPSSRFTSRRQLVY